MRFDFADQFAHALAAYAPRYRETIKQMNQEFSRVGHRFHPAYFELVRRYREARQAWASNPTVRETALLFGMDERAYCAAYVGRMPVITWTSSSSVNQPINSAMVESAYEEAAHGR